MAISVDGLISGLDSTSIISQIIELEKRPINLIENKQSALVDQKVAWQEVNTRLLAFETAANKMNSSSEFASRSSKFSNNNSNGGSVLSVTSSSSATDGTYNIAISQLAQAQKSASDQSFTATNTAVGASGTITIGGTNVSVTETDTLEDIKNAINNSGASVTATIINSGTTASPAYQMMLTGSAMGSAASFATSATLDKGAFSFTSTQTAQDASFTVDGVTITKDSNTVNDVISGATLNLETAGSGTVTFTTDYDGIVSNVQNFVDTYNEAMNFINEQFKYDQGNNTRGILFGNATLLTIQDQLRSAVTGTVQGMDPSDTTEFSFLSQAGISTNQENHLEMDESKFRDSLKDNYTDTQNLFISSGSGTYSFVSATGDTRGGDYSAQVVDTGGGTYRLQMKLSGTSDWLTLDQTGNFAYGQTGTILDGLIIRTGTFGAGDVGSSGNMNIAIGVAQKVATLAANFTEFSTEGLIFNQSKSIEDQDKEFQKQIDDLTERVGIKEEALRVKFSNLEVLLSKLNSEQQYLNGQLGTLSQGWK